MHIKDLPIFAEKEARRNAEAKIVTMELASMSTAVTLMK